MQRHKRLSNLISTLSVAVASISIGTPGQGRAEDAPRAHAAQHRDENGEALRRGDDALTLTLTYNSDANADVSGGERRGAAYLQRIGVIGDADLSRAVGWRGASAHISVHSIAGAGLSGGQVGNLLTVSGIEAPAALRLFNLWVEQKVGSSASVRVGQFTAGQEFAISPTANFFVNSTFGWPGSFATDLPGGGPAYPISVPGVRIAAALDSRKTAIRAAIFAGNPPGADLHGIAGWQFRSQPFAIAEVVRTSAGDDPAWVIVAGAWTSFDRFADQRSAAGQPLSGNYAIYMIGDARVWTCGARTARAFARFTVSPGDRNLISRYIDAGVTVTGAFASRPQDVMGLAVAAAEISPVRPIGGPDPQRAASPPAEMAIEASYQLHLGRVFYIQPNAQLVFNPYDVAQNVKVASPPQHTRRALIFGIRTSLRL